MSAICAKNATEKQLKTQQKILVAILRPPQGNKTPWLGNPQDVQTYLTGLQWVLMRSPSQEKQWQKSTAGEPATRPTLTPPPPQKTLPTSLMCPSSSVTVFFKGRKKRGETPQTLKGLESSQNLGGKTPPCTFPAGPMAFLRGALGQGPAPLLGFQWKREQNFTVGALTEAGWNRELWKYGWPEHPHREKIISVETLKHCSNESTKKLVLANKCCSNSNFVPT